jgi:hypothetical protein
MVISHTICGLKSPAPPRIEPAPFGTGVSEVNSRVSEIATFAFYLKMNGYRDSTISGTVENNTVTITPLKGSYARQLKVSSKLMGLLNGLKRKLPTYVFRNSKVDLYKASKRYRTEFMLQRRYTSAKLNQPRLNLISFKSLRHHYACRLYESTYDIEYRTACSVHSYEVGDFLSRA